MADEQLLKSYKKALDDIETICTKLLKQLKCKKRECDELKKTVMYKCPHCGNEYLSPIGASLYEKNKEYSQTLIDIKEYFIKECETCKEQYAITNENCADCQAQEILQKIREVLNDR